MNAEKKSPAFPILHHHKDPSRINAPQILSAAFNKRKVKTMLVDTPSCKELGITSGKMVDLDGLKLKKISGISFAVHIEDKHIYIYDMLQVQRISYVYAMYIEV